MAYPAVPSVVLLGIDTVQLSHATGEITFWRLNQKVVMIVMLLADFAKQAKERRTIVVIFVDRLTPVTAGGDVVKRAGKFQSERSGHSLAPLVTKGTRLPISSALGNTDAGEGKRQDLTLGFLVKGYKKDRLNYSRLCEEVEVDEVDEDCRVVNPINVHLIQLPIFPSPSISF